MKVILTGTSGFVGKEILHQSLAHPKISSIVVLTRRPLQLPADPKLKVIVHEDFLTYPDTLLKELHGAASCIWALGTNPGNNSGYDAVRRINVDYTKAAADAFESKLAPQLEGKTKFKFVYLSGVGTERNQEQNSLWFLGDFRRIRGEVENKIIDITTTHPSTFQSTIFRPCMICSKNNPIPSTILSWSKSIKVDELSAAMVDAAVGGEGYGQFVELDEMGAKGRSLLDRG